MTGPLWTVALCLLFITKVTTDFDIHSPDELFEIVYHEMSNLLLTFHGTGCYFAYVDPSLKDRLLHGGILFQLQKQIQTVIEADDSPQKYPSSLDVVRAQFSDVLADYRCAQHRIFLLWLDYLACDFQGYASLCGWRDLQESLQWRLHRGSTATVLTGPDTDHTLATQEGQYLYLESSEGREGEVAEIVSPVVQPTDSLCLRFWYSMHGTDVGSLTVSTASEEADGTRNNSSILWHTSGNHGNVWRLAEVTVPPEETRTHPGYPWEAALEKGYRVYLRATRGGGIYGDIAIDDVSSAPGVCAPEKLNCSFEAGEGLCLWVQGGSGVPLRWLIHAGATDTAGTGPDSALHTANDDNHSYLYLEADAGDAGDLAELRSPSFFIPSPLCLSFWYHMKGSGVHSLAVLLRRAGWNADTLLWQRQGGTHHSATWLQAHLTLPPTHPHTPHRLVMRAMRGGTIYGDIAIDLISLASGACGNKDIPS